MNRTQQIAKALSIKASAVLNTLDLLNGGATVPFIARYRKERTGSLDEVQIRQIRDLDKSLTELENRRTFILESIESQGKLDPALAEKIKTATTLTQLEDLYLPYKPRKKTRADKAREAGLEPLAKILMRQQTDRVEQEARHFTSPDLPNAEQALAGARDIIAEWINEHEGTRQSMRRLYASSALIRTKVAKGKEDQTKYRDYFDFSENLSKAPAHRIHAMLRGADEGVLKLSISPDTEQAVHLLSKRWVKSNNAAGNQVMEALQDSYKRLLGPSMETEFKKLAKAKADETAINTFAENLRQLLLAPPLGETAVMAIDPGFRTGCKVVCLNEQGDLIQNFTIYPNPPQNAYDESLKKVLKAVQKHRVKAIGIGNGTASRETEQFIRSLPFQDPPEIFSVNESGASIYSASTIAREEFPQFDVTVRGAISIGRRLMDPLAELVKIDPKSIGVGQYQHDVDQKKLKDHLDQVVEYCVNKVGINVNTASRALLTYVSGLGPKTAQNIVDYRSENGPFYSRNQLKKVPRLGAKAFEQCAGFLRIRKGKNPLDNSAVHPESYKVVQQMAKSLKTDIKTLIGNTALINRIELNKFVTENTGMPTLLDIQKELAKPGLDPRGNAVAFSFSDKVRTMEDLVPEMILPGIITNITQFGAFVDIGVKQDGLVHISEMADRFVKDPMEVVCLNQQVRVRVVSVDAHRKRISLSLKNLD